MITVYNSSFRVRKGLKKLPAAQKHTCAKRSKITGFSSKSSSRLKDLILSVDTNLYLGFTLTFPCFTGWESFDFVEFMRVFKQHLFRQIGIPFIWRLELQQNKRPHYHCMLPLYFDSYLDFARLTYTIKRCWVRQLDNNKIVYPTTDFLTHFQYVFTSQGLNYLVLHASKHKQLQISMAGRSWGVVGKRFMRFRRLDFRLPSFLENQINRTFRKYLFKNFCAKSSYSSFFVIKYSSLYKSILISYCKKYFPVGFFDKFFECQEKK